MRFHLSSFRKSFYRCFLGIGLFSALHAAACRRDERNLRIAITTTVERIGVMQTLVDAFSRETGIPVQVLVMTSGQALSSLAAGDIQAAVVHAPGMETAFKARHADVQHFRLAASAYAILGPASDPAGVARAASPEDAFARIARANVLFLSRGDASGTYEFEESTWKKTGIRPKPAFYLESGRGMDETLIMAAEKNAYTLAPLPSFLLFAASERYTSCCHHYVMLFCQPESMENPYTFMYFPSRCPFPPCRRQRLADFLKGAAARKILREFRIQNAPVFRVEAP